MPDNPDPVIAPDISVEFTSDRENYVTLLARFENLALSALSEPGVACHLRLDEVPPTEFEVLKGRAIKATHAINGARMLRKWQAEAEIESIEAQERFYHIAYWAFTTAMTASMVGTTFSHFESEAENAAARRSKGGVAKSASVKARNEVIRSALIQLWENGARFNHLGQWSQAVIDARPDLAPPGDSQMERYERIISPMGKSMFGDEWPVRGRGRRVSSPA